jgi:hypothetical protein
MSLINAAASFCSSAGDFQSGILVADVEKIERNGGRGENGGMWEVGTASVSSNTITVAFLPFSQLALATKK